MISAIDYGLTAFTVLPAIPIGVLFVECMAALLPAPTKAPATSAPRIAVLMPAHNEAVGIAAVLAALKPQLREGDRLVVVADNCTDETAAIARQQGAIVIERHDPERRGKGYALDFGIRYLETAPPDVVVMMDADCIAQPGTIQHIAQLALQHQRPVQAVYLMEQPAQPSPKSAVSALAFLVKNLVRPTGLHRLDFPCLLTGTGMAFPWRVIQASPLASGNLVEDMQLGLDLAIAGSPPLLCEDALVIGNLPQQTKAATTQRTRWEHGHLKTLLTQVPTLLKAGIAQRRLDLVAIALDLAVPPLSLLVLLWAVCLALTAALVWQGATVLPLKLLLLQGGLLLGAIATAWAHFGRETISPQQFAAIPLYIFWKIPLYLAFLVRPQTKWVRTQRDS